MSKELNQSKGNVMELHLINGIKKKPNKRNDVEWLDNVYKRIVINNLKRFSETLDRHYVEGACLCQVRRFNLMVHNNEIPLEKKKEYGDKIVRILGLLTPSEFKRTFPINKIYNGAKWECNDYFSTMEKFKDIPDNEAICCHVDTLEFLYGYDNHDILRFSAGLLTLVGKIVQLNTGKDLFTSFCEEQGLEPPTAYHLHKDAKGREFMISDKGEVVKVDKPKPRLRVIK